MWRREEASADPSAGSLRAVHTQLGASERKAILAAASLDFLQNIPSGSSAFPQPPPSRLIPSVFHPTFTRCKKFRVPAKYSPSFEKAYVPARLPSCFLAHILPNNKDSARLLIRAISNRDEPRPVWHARQEDRVRPSFAFASAIRPTVRIVLARCLV